MAIMGMVLIGILIFIIVDILSPKNAKEEIVDFDTAIDKQTSRDSNF